jgi:hypothetical protein
MCERRPSKSDCVTVSVCLCGAKVLKSPTATSMEEASESAYAAPHRLIRGHSRGIKEGAGACVYVAPRRVSVRRPGTVQPDNDKRRPSQSMWRHVDAARMNARTYARTHARTHVRTRARTCARAHASTQAAARTHSPTQARTHACTRAQRRRDGPAPPGSHGPGVPQGPPRPRIRVLR